MGEGEDAAGIESYLDAVAAVARVRVDELRADFEVARKALAVAEADLAEARRRVESIKWLLVLADETAADESAQTPEVLTLHAAMQVVLADAPGSMMRAGDLAAVIQRRGLYRMRDGRPVEAQQVRARVNNYSHLFEWAGTFIRLRRT